MSSSVTFRTAPLQSTDETGSAVSGSNSDVHPTTNGSASPLIVGKFSDYNTFMALNAAREYRQLSLEQMDELAGSSKGYWSKVLAPGGSRCVTLRSLADGFAVLAVECAMMLNEKEWSRIRQRVVARKAFQAHGGTVHFSFSQKFMRRIGKKGGQARMQQLIASRRLAQHQRNAALARWRKPKIVEVKSRTASA